MQIVKAEEVKDLITGYSMAHEHPVVYHTLGIISLEPGTSINFKLSAEQYCIGYDDPTGDTKSCPTGTRATQGAQCDACREKAQIAPCLKCIGNTCANPARRKKCVFADHYVYLAAYDLKNIKVGVTRTERLYNRIREQGAWGAIAIAAAGGQEVRRIEHQINLSGWVDRVKLLPLLCQPLAEPDACEKALREELIRVAKRIPDVEYLDTGPFVWCAHHYPAPLDFPPRSLDLRFDPFAGTVVGVRGGYILLEVQGEIIACSLRSMVGREVTPLASEIVGPSQGALVF